MSGHIKYFDADRNNMSVKIEDDVIFSKYNEIWNKILCLSRTEQI